MTKPARASGRASTQGPRSSSTQGRKRGPEKALQDAGPSRKMGKEGQLKRSNIQKSQPKRRVGNAAAAKFKGQDKWKPLPKTSITALESMLNLSILSVLTMRRKDKEESQRHLNLLKDRFLASCAQLKVPPRKQGDMLQVSRLYQAEIKKKTMGQKTLQTLEEEVSTVVGTLEQVEVRMESLDRDTVSLRAQLEEEEEHVQEILQLSGQGVLNLPPLPPVTAPEAPLQERMARMLKSPSAAARLAGVLHSSQEVQELRAFLELAHLKADRLLLDDRSSAAAPQAPESNGV